MQLRSDELMSLQQSPFNYQPANDYSFLENHGLMRLFGGLNTINNNVVNYQDPFMFNPNVLNFNVAQQVQQELGQQPNNVGSTSRVKPPRMLWTEDLHREFVAVVDAYGGPWAVKPRHILKEMAHLGISHCQIKNRLQSYRAKLNPNDAGGRKYISKASSKKELIQDVQEQLKNVDGGKVDDDVCVPQLPTEAKRMEAHISPEDAFIEGLLNWI
uniref:HTH myb-type domain-containing protein n=1 Tax=Solanum lycopersicum TaxID=4081 RepID=A0A3Q7J4J1_SOLLC